jgi:hypothetical protein
MHFVNIRLFFCYLSFSLFFFSQEILAMEKEEERENPSSERIAIRLAYPHLEDQLKHFCTFIKGQEDREESVRITLWKSPLYQDSPSRKNWIYLSYATFLTPDTTYSLWVGFNDFEALRYVARYVLSSIDHIRCGPEVFNFLGREHYSIFNRMLSGRGRFWFFSKEMCPTLLPEDLYTSEVEEQLSRYHELMLYSNVRDRGEVLRSEGLTNPLPEVLRDETSLRCHIVFVQKQKAIRHEKENTAPMRCDSEKVRKTLETFFDKVTLVVPWSGQSSSSQLEDFTIIAESPKGTSEGI